MDGGVKRQSWILGTILRKVDDEWNILYNCESDSITYEGIVTKVEVRKRKKELRYSNFRVDDCNTHCPLSISHISFSLTNDYSCRS